MILNMSGGGGASLNFKVVGNPQPASAKENTIWVDANEITSYIFSVIEPESPAPNMVWFSTSTESSIAFSVTKKNPIMIYPLSAKQYVGGAWVDKPAKSWQNGAWVDWWNGELFDNGKQYENVTGGWTCTSDTLSAATINGGKIVIGVAQGIRTTNPINNMGKYTRICFNAESVSGTYHTMILTSKPHGYSSGDAAYGSIDVKNGLNYIEIGAIDGDFYVEFYVARSTGAMTISKVWME